MLEYAETFIDKYHRQLFKMPLRSITVSFSVLFFAIIAFGSSFTYYFAMRKVLSTSFTHEMEKILSTRQIILNAKLDREVLLLKMLAEAPIVEEYFLEPGDEELKKECFSVLAQYANFFYSKMLGWINVKDSIYYVNGQFMEKYHKSNSAHLWFFETLESESPPLIRVDYDYLNRKIYDIYINYPVYSGGKAIGVLSGRISLFEFVSDLDLPENVYVFGKDGIIVGAADEKIAKDKKTLSEQFGYRGKEVHERSLDLDKNSKGSFDIGNRHYLLRNTGDLDLFLVARYEIDINTILQERASTVFLALLFIIFLIFIIFNIFMYYLLKPVNQNMLLYMRSSFLDELTKIPNRRFFNMKMEYEWNRAVKSRLPMGFLMMDLDKFKSYNDTRGHLEGDILLREVARIFKNCISRKSDFVARFGGEEFCVILPNTRTDGALRIAEDIRASVEKAGKITISIGLICKIPSLTDDYKDFMEKADKNLYEAKNTGRNKIC
jgi:diguanylate cyclase (GGDEF)-like protein